MREGANPNATATSQSFPSPLPSHAEALVPLATAPASLTVIDQPAAQRTELAAQADGALARINTMQLLNAEAANVAPAWLLEIPYLRDQQPETLRFRFERNASRDGGGEQSWTVETAMNLGVAGALHARISLYGKRVGVQLRADSPALVSVLSSQTPLLTSMLTEAGLEVSNIVCLHGMPAQERDMPTTTLLDVRA